MLFSPLLPFHFHKWRARITCSDKHTYTCTDKRETMWQCSIEMSEIPRMQRQNEREREWGWKKKLRFGKWDTFRSYLVVAETRFWYALRTIFSYSALNAYVPFQSLRTDRILMSRLFFPSFLFPPLFLPARRLSWLSMCTHSTCTQVIKQTTNEFRYYHCGLSMCLSNVHRTWTVNRRRINLRLKMSTLCATIRNVPFDVATEMTHRDTKILFSK